MFLETIAEWMNEPVTQGELLKCVIAVAMIYVIRRRTRKYRKGSAMAITRHRNNQQENKVQRAMYYPKTMRHKKTDRM
ncbi:MAG TPA: hypothetical protein VNX00_01360 [Herbaspirillum sp.]|jgi:hypothetical protein|nr:hypothetical protein [Herbaspirillum sp.]